MVVLLPLDEFAANQRSSISDIVIYNNEEQP
jgi:hypothetical protein